MKKNKLQIFSSLRFLLITVLLLVGNLLFAEGSKDLYPNGTPGYRAYLRSNTSNAGWESSWPFPNEGTHYVYAKAGEVITLASSAQNGGSGRIRLFLPDGTLAVNNTTGGQISNRAAELAGPRLVGQAAGGNRYLPIYHNVTVEGIYRVEFVSRGTGDPLENAILANSNWTQSNDNNIAAWDVSVINAANSNFITGRVYTNTFNMSTTVGTPPENKGVYSIFYVQTKDGYTYKINNNGNYGMFFQFFANNNGFTNSITGLPIYKSLAAISSANIKNPNTADDTNITHKLFYSLPSADLPASSNGAVPGGSTWVKSNVVSPDVTNVGITGIEGTNNQISGKGGHVKFTTAAVGRYTITIASNSLPTSFTTRVLTGNSSAGVNSVFWDGKDGNGIALPAGSQPVAVTVKMQTGEVHFPFFDMEYNKNGTIIELLDHSNLNNVISDIVYWDDTDVPDGSNGSVPSPKNNSHLPPANSTGISSNVNGHRYGVGATGTAFMFGDQRAIDTWTFIESSPVTINTSVEVKIADLKVTHVMPDKSAVSVGELLTYTVKVKNDGPSSVTGAPFTFILPAGLNPQSLVFTANGCGSESAAVTYNPATRTYSSALNLPNGCEITYKFTVTVTASATPGNLTVKAGILRPNDVTDPDATNPNPAVPPTNAEYECANNGLGGNCNNLLNNSNVLFSPTPICTEDVQGNAFSTANGTPVTFSQPATDFGFVFDIYTLDNSFNLNINGTQLSTQEIQFSTGAPNIRFADGSVYGSGGVPEIWQIIGTSSAPSVRVNISATGAVTLFGSKTSGGPLFPLELYNGAAFNTITWNVASANIVTATQVVVGPTYMTGYGSGKKIVPCHCIKPGATGTPDSYAQIGILTKPSITAANWPKNVPNGQLVLDSAGKGLVITHMTTAQRNALVPVEGMVIYNTDLKCVQLYRGTAPGVDASRTGWNCIKRGCNE